MSEEELSPILQHAFGNPSLNDEHTSLHWDIFQQKKHKHNIARKHEIHVVDGKQTNKPNGYEEATAW